MLLTRVITAATGGAGFLTFLWVGGSAWSVLWLWLALLGAREYMAMLRGKGHNPWAAGLYAGIVALHIGSGLDWWGDLDKFTLGLGLTFLISAGVSAVSPKYTFLDGALTAHGLLYLGWFTASFAQFRGLGPGVVLLTFLVIWGTDTMAYFGGRFLGRNLLAPKISPKKTVEGAFLGILGAILIAVLAGPALLSGPTGGALTVFQLGAGAAVLSVLGQVGDLYESALKRYCGVKDSGNTLPGHGGILDRFDSALFVGPVSYWLLKLVILQ